MEENILEMKNINKSFPGVKALDSVDFDLKQGEVHAIFGENGAGKTTLIKILAGIYAIDKGCIYIHGSEARINNVNDARNLHIAVIHQELCLVPYISVAMNIFLGREAKDKFGLMNDNYMNAETQQLFDSLGLDIQAKKSSHLIA